MFLKVFPIYLKVFPICLKVFPIVLKVFPMFCYVLLCFVTFWYVLLCFLRRGQPEILPTSPLPSGVDTEKIDKGRIWEV